MNHLATFRDVCHIYDSHLVLENVSFSLEGSTITTLVGPNGAGKTTIGRLLLGLEKPSGGIVDRRSNNLSYVPQKFSVGRDLPLTAKAFMEYLSPNKESHAFFKDVIEFSGLYSLENIQVTELSGGQLQRLLLASAILKNPELLVLDEPTQGLDISGQEEFYHILDKLSHNGGATIFIISHDLFTVMKKSHQVLCLNQHICCQGRPSHTVVRGTDNIGIYAHTHDHKHGI